MIYYARIPFTIGNGNIRLRRLLFTDIPFLREALKEEGICPSSNIVRHKIFSSWLSLWWRIRKTFAVIYCIELTSERVGFIGLYNLEPGKSSEISLIIFKREKRRCGYGSGAFALLAHYLKNHRILDRIIVKTGTDNIGSIGFWRKLGFKEVNVAHEIMTMYMDLDNYTAGSNDIYLVNQAGDKQVR